MTRHRILSLSEVTRTCMTAGLQLLSQQADDHRSARSSSVASLFHRISPPTSVVDCVVSAWGPWSTCDSECGPGAQTRSRLVERAAENGGKHCPQLVQNRGCHGSKCHRRNPKSALKEVALLLPAELSETRQVNDSNDIRSNLRLRYHDDPEHDASKEYCITFTVTKASKACYKEASLAGLTEVLSNMFFFKSSPTCSITLKYKHMPPADAANLEWRVISVAYRQAGQNQWPGAHVCVRCQTQALRRVLDWRCEGDGGAEAMITRWSMLSSAHCHGKWLRTSKTGPECDASVCQPEPHFIFV